MSLHARLIHWLEKTLQVPVTPKTPTDTGTRLLHIAKALWFRPNPLPPPSSRTQRIGAGLPKPIIQFSHFIQITTHDLTRPLKPIAQRILNTIHTLHAHLSKRLDQTVHTLKPAHYMLKASQKLNKKPWLTIPLLLISIGLFTIVSQIILPQHNQLIFTSICFGCALIFRRLTPPFSHLCLMALTMLMLCRYIFWRVTSSLDLTAGIEQALGYLLFAAEAYTWIVLIFGFIQTAWPLKRPHQPLQTTPEQWPTIDVFIPTYNEPLSVLKTTVHAARGLDWPQEKINIYLLDDGHRPAFEAFAHQANIEYISRPDNAHAKAGNINHALQHTHGDYIAIFDCDHIPTRSFLQTSMGWFQQDPQCALIQTPHHFFSADPFERNFNRFRQMPNEGNLFYGLIQDGNDFWNASFFCGSCAIIQRKALQSIGGIATETVTEDAHTSLKLHAQGYSSVYLNIPQAAGLATETLADHIGQRIRWARGMAQIFRLDNPFLKKGLTAFQRICYGNAMLHFFYGIPRLLFLIMPLAYLYFEHHLINAAAQTILSYAIPQLMISAYTNATIQGPYRRSYWSEVYETVLSWYIILPTTLAFINPKLGKFNVTAKGGLIQKSYFDHQIALPYLILMLFNLIGFFIGLGRLFFWNTWETGTVLMNLFWCLFNLSLLGTAVGVASETIQQRQHHRIRMIIPAFLQLPGGHTINCHTEEYSAAGLILALPYTPSTREFSKIQVGLQRGDREFLFPATLHTLPNGKIEARFDKLTPEQESQFIQCTFGRADAWLDWQENPQQDKAFSGLKDVAIHGLKGYKRLFIWLLTLLHTGLSRLVRGKKTATHPWEQ